MRISSSTKAQVSTEVSASSNLPNQIARMRQCVNPLRLKAMFLKFARVRVDLVAKFASAAKNNPQLFR